MKKIFVLLSFIFLLNGCVESIAMLGSGASNGKMLQSSLNSAISYGVKKQTGKTPLGHALAYAEEKNPEKKKEPCVAFIKKTNSEICAVVKKQITSTNTMIKKKALLIVKKTPKITEIAVVEKINKTKDAVVIKKKNSNNDLVKTNKSVRELAIALQFEIKQKSKNYYLSQ